MSKLKTRWLASVLKESAKPVPLPYTRQVRAQKAQAKQQSGQSAKRA